MILTICFAKLCKILTESLSTRQKSVAPTTAINAVKMFIENNLRLVSEPFFSSLVTIGNAKDQIIIE
jgi:hypothetical protein